MVSSALPSQDAAVPLVSKRPWIDIGEVAIGYALIEAALWTQGSVRLAFSLGAMVWFIAATVVHRRPLRELGLGIAGLKEAAPIAPLALLVAGGIITLARSAGTLHDLYGVNAIWLHILGYGLWALQQQFVAQSFIFTRLERVLGPGRAVIVTGVLFSLAHVPNSFLMAVTLGGGLVFSEIFRRHRNIYPLAVAHAFIGLALAIAVPDSTLRHMRVGIGFLHYHAN